MTNTDKVRKIVKTAFSDKFPDVRIVKINFQKRVDHDGDDVLMIKVIFNGKHLDSAKTSSLVRNLLPKMAEAGETSFPVLSFIAESDLGKKSPELSASDRNS